MSTDKCSFEDINPQPTKGKNWHEYKGIKYDVDTFYDELAWEEIKINRDGSNAVHKVWGYTQDAFPCPSCNMTQDVHFNIQRTGVVMKCDYCKISILAPPFDVDKGEKIAELLLTETVNLEDAFKIAERIGILLPIAPPRHTRRQRAFGKKKFED